MIHYTSPDGYDTEPELSAAIAELEGFVQDIDARIKGRRRLLEKRERQGEYDPHYKAEVEAYKDVRYMLNLRLDTLRAYLDYRKEMK